MTVLCWDKPQRVRSTEEQNAISADGAPPGVYTPNMSQEDKQKWKAKVTGTRKGQPQVEIRKSLRGGVQLLIIVGLRGYNYKHYQIGDQSSIWNRTDGLNIHFSLNGGGQMTFEDFEQMHQAVTEARHHLEENFT